MEWLIALLTLRKLSRFGRRIIRTGVALVVLVVAIAFMAGKQGFTLPTVVHDTARQAVATQATVVRVIDGDTIRVTLDDGREETVRLLGIDAPEVSHGTNLADCGGDQATTVLAGILPTGTRVDMTSDPVSDDRDRYDRLLRYVTYSGTDVATMLLLGGWVEAWYPSSVSMPTRYQDYHGAQLIARATSAGSWATCETLGR